VGGASSGASTSNQVPNGNSSSVGQPGFWESLIPVWGSGRSAVDHFENGNYWRGTGYTLLAITDVFLVKSLVVGAGKLISNTAFKTGSHSWKATRAWMGRKGLAEKGQHVHHIFLHRNQGIGKYIVNSIKNQPWNLKAIKPIGKIKSALVHQAIHRKSKRFSLNLVNRLYYGGTLRVVPYGVYSAKTMNEILNK
jgi:hypothetical protein